MREWRAANPERNRENGKRNDKKRWSANVEKFTAKRRERMRRWKLRNPEEYRRQALEKYRRVRERAVDRLGGKCVCCGEVRRTMLHVDHIYNDGYKDGRKRNSYSLMKTILRTDNPHAEYQILCGSCNHSKARNGGLCEHYTEKWMCFLSGDEPDPGPYPFAPKDATPHDPKRILDSWVRL